MTYLFFASASRVRPAGSVPNLSLYRNHITQRSLDVPNAALATENAIIGTWKLQSLVFEATATGQRSSPFGDHPVGYLSYSTDGRTPTSNSSQNSMGWQKSLEKSRLAMLSPPGLGFPMPR
jgi:lipocalin-like protein